jgi:hypothetical protein
MLCLISCLFLLVQITPCLAQEPDTVVKDRAYYTQKAKNQNTTGWVLLAGGAAAATTGLIIASNNFEIFGDENDAEFTAGGVILIVGTASMLGSIPFFISGAKNKGRAQAATASFSMEQLQPTAKAVLGRSHIPSLKLSIPIR